MKLKLIAGAAALALSAVIASPAQAITITNSEVSGTTFTGFDWAQGGTAFTTGFTGVAGQSFSLTVFTWATSVNNGFNTVHLNNLQQDAVGSSEFAGAYMYTVVATIQESILGCTTPGAFSSCTFSITSGNYNIYYQTNPTANAQTGAGFSNGTSIISGAISAAADGGNFTSDGMGNGKGGASLSGTVTNTNLTYINPTLSGSTAFTTLQLGSSFTNGYIAPTTYNGNLIASLPGHTAADVVLQADANQSFSTTTVPEPTSIALVGAALVGLGVASRRRQRR